MHRHSTFDMPTVCLSNGYHFGRFHPYPLSMTDKIRHIYPTDDFYDAENFEHLAARFRSWEDSQDEMDINTIGVARVFEDVKTLLNS